MYYIGIAILAVAALWIIARSYEKRIKTLNKDVDFWKIENDQTELDYRKILNQKKSSEVRTGFITEKLAPFLEGFPANPENCQFLGQPIDFIAFENDTIKLIEVKSGRAQLTKRQREIRQLVKDKKIEFISFRVGGESTDEWQRLYNDNR